MCLMSTAEAVVVAACPVCGEPIGAAARCVRCAWTLRTGFVLGSPSPEDRVDFDERMRAACRAHDLRCAARAAGFPTHGDDLLLARLLRFVRGGTPGGEELTAAKSLPSPEFSVRSWPAGAGACVEVGADGITLIRFGVESGQVYEFAETEHVPWRKVLPTLPDDAAEQRFVLAGGRPVDTAALSGTLDRVGVPIAIQGSVPGWPVPERVAAVLRERHPAATVSYVDSPARREWHESGRIAAFAASDDGLVIATGAVDGTVRMRTSDGHHESAVHESRVTGVDLAGGAVVSGGQDGVVRLWHPADGRTRVLATHDGWVNAVRIAGTLAFSLGDDGKLRRSPLDAAGNATPLDVGWAASSALAVSARAEIVAFGGTDGQVRIHDGRTWAHRHTLAAGAAVRALAVDPGGELLAVACDDNSVATFDLESGQPLTRLAVPDVVTCVYVADDGTVAFGDELGRVALWRRAAPAHRVLVGRHADSVVGVTMTRAGAVVSAGRGGLVRTWPHREEKT
jgi:hypothetical protein